MDTLVSQRLNDFRKAIEQFVVFNEYEWQLFITRVGFLTLKKKQHFAEEGKVCNYIAFISSGAVRYYYIKDGEDITGYFSFEKELTSSYTSFLTRKPALNYIQAMDHTELITISWEAMQAMYADPVLSYKMQQFGRLVAEFYLLCYDDRMSSFLTQTPEERYQKLLQNNRDILQRIPQHYVANFLGITPVSLSRIRRRMLKSA